MSETVTRGIRIKVVPEFNARDSNLSAGVFVYGYHVTIENQTAEEVQLVARHWIIRDGLGREEHVKGPGVVGKQPTLLPGQSFQYSSFCPLQTPTGSMQGSFQMKRADGSTFDAVIEEFFLREKSFVN